MAARETTNTAACEAESEAWGPPRMERGPAEDYTGEWPASMKRARGMAAPTAGRVLPGALPALTYSPSNPLPWSWCGEGPSPRPGLSIGVVAVRQAQQSKDHGPGTEGCQGGKPQVPSKEQL